MLLLAATIKFHGLWNDSKCFLLGSTVALAIVGACFQWEFHKRIEEYRDLKTGAMCRLSPASRSFMASNEKRGKVPVLWFTAVFIVVQTTSAILVILFLSFK
jgi:hypothetical protein